MLFKKHIIIENIQRTYFLFIPDRIKINFLILSLHGAGGNAKISMYETNLIEEAKSKGFIIAFPEALPQNLFEEPDFKSNPRIWQAKDINNKPSIDLFFIQELIQSIKKEYKIENIYVTGFSNGAIMASYLLLKIPHLINAIAPVCGKLLPPNENSIILPTILIVGDSDPIFPIKGGIVKLFWGNQINVPSFEEYTNPYIELITPPREITVQTKHHYEITNIENKSTQFTMVRVFKHGHIWPGGKSKLTYRITGPSNKNISANELIINFFISLQNKKQLSLIK